MAKAGAKVTILEAAAELGEIGAGIQMTPNAARLLIRWGVDKVVGDDLVEFEELNIRRKDGTKIGYTKMIPNIRRNLGVPWWVVHRMHVHAGLTEVARQNGVDVVTGARVDEIDWTSNNTVTVRSTTGSSWTFDLLVGADGVSSIVRRKVFPNVKPTPPSKTCAYRAVVPVDQIRADPIAKELVDRLTMNMWLMEGGYVISYPISGGRDFNMVLEHQADRLIWDVEDADIEECRSRFEDFDPRIKRVIDMVPSVRRWPLLHTCLKSWSTPEKNIVLIGDAAHSMTNHMAQGAATSMEDGAYLGRTIAAVVDGKITLPEAISVYEKGRMPKADLKQQISYLDGVIYHLPDGPLQEARDRVMSIELTKPDILVRTPNLYGDPQTWINVYGYDAEEHANGEIADFMKETEQRNSITGVTSQEAQRYLGWWWPDKGGPQVSKL